MSARSLVRWVQRHSRPNRLDGRRPPPFYRSGSGVAGRDRARRPRPREDAGGCGRRIASAAVYNFDEAECPSAARPARVGMRRRDRIDGSLCGDQEANRRRSGTGCTATGGAKPVTASAGGQSLATSAGTAATAAEGEDREGAGRAGSSMRMSAERASRYDSSVVAGSVWSATSSSPVPRSARNCALRRAAERLRGRPRPPPARPPSGRRGRSGPAARSRRAGRRARGGGGRRGACCREPGVELGRRVAVVDEQELAALERAPRARDPVVDARGRSRPAGRARARCPPPPAVRRARASTVDRARSSNRRPRPRASRTARGARHRAPPSTRWTGRASSSSLARIAPGAGSSSSGSRWPSSRPRRAARRARRAGPARRRPPGRRSHRAAASPTRRRPSRMPAASAPEPAPCSRTTKRAGRSIAAQTDSRCRATAQPKIGWPSGAVRKSPWRPGPVAPSGVVPRLRVVQRELHEPGERHRARRRGSRRAMRRDQARVALGQWRAGSSSSTLRSPSTIGRRGAARPSGHAGDPQREPEPRPDEAVPAERDRDLRAPRRAGSAAGATGRGRGRRAGGPRRTGPRRSAMPPRPGRVGGPAGRGVDDRRRRRAVRRASRSPSVPHGRGGARAPRRAAAASPPPSVGRGRECAQAALLDERPDAARRVSSSSRSVAADSRPATSSSRRGSRAIAPSASNAR